MSDWQAKLEEKIEKSLEEWGAVETQNEPRTKEIKIEVDELPYANEASLKG